MKKLVLVFLGLTAIVFAGTIAPQCCSLGATAYAEAHQTKTATLTVEKMTCGGCAVSVKVVVKKIDGVVEATVSYEEKKAVVTYDPRKTTAESIAATINEKLPYVATVVSDEVESK